VRIRSFGHAGDGNLHIYTLKDDLDDGRWIELRDRIFDRLYERARELGGLVSGEHGIGWAKTPYFAKSMDDAGLDLIRGIKRAFDPQGILNPGKILGDL
jgi:glycolate oxidase